ncbi:ABC transporter permease [Micromonospora parathelypteridis]|uniref:Putative spermidine/putrescine transport system permease protein n=1 Tax=Micromonospora parathelypteridis TaxID=1839617 RepID=A0A840VUT8_9ACTN|nr:ABC transporter permease [Micromonospora parathelypteridis]MBB5481002.1 putative spermidine/putrescine transport system permease protein [Micromonospora parathelypteridis]GGO20561.1 spermidine/putrescine ABC transporter permease [Micromonospora parathelypteridis]
MATITRARPARPPATTDRRRRITARPAAWIVWGVVIFFFLNLLGVVASVLVSSFGRRWFDTWLPDGYTTSWYGRAWDEFALLQVIVVTLEVSVLVVGLSLLIGVPAAYVLARRSFPGKRLIFLVFLLPILMPPITYGIPLATVLYKFGLAGHMSGVVLANLVPSVPFVILTMTPFIEQIDPRIESAARMCGAGLRTVFLRVLTPLLVPGILASAILVLVRTVGMFELTFLTAGPDSQTLVVALYYSMSASGIRAQQSVDAMAVIYTSMMLVLLVVALRYVNPTQLVAQVKEDPEH